MINCDPPPPEIKICGDEFTTPLMAGQSIDAGEVVVSNDGDYLYINFVVDDPWILVESHVAVSLTLDGIPLNKSGNPKIGLFPYADGAVIDLSQFGECGTELFIAAHAVVKMWDGFQWQTQTGWGQGSGFDGNSWAMYFNYTIQCCPKEVSIPDEPVDALFYYPGPNSYWDTHLSNVPAGHSVWDGAWLGWCVDQGHYIQPGNQYTVYLYSSYDPDMPDYAKDEDWDKVNYIINHKQGVPDDVQNAIWYYINGGHWPSDPDAQAMINDAEANGEGFEPMPGEWFAVILDPVENTNGDRSQLTFIEVDP